MTGPGSPSPAPAVLQVVEAGADGEDAAELEVDLDTGDADREVTAVLVARARMDGAMRVRTAHPRAARRAAAVIDAIAAARTDAATRGPGA